MNPRKVHLMLTHLHLLTLLNYYYYFYTETEDIFINHFRVCWYLTAEFMTTNIVINCHILFEMSDNYCHIKLRADREW